jgi:urease accessory protein
MHILPHGARRGTPVELFGMSVRSREDLPASQGWQAQLELSFERGSARTELTHRRHEGPLLVQKPFYPEREFDLDGRLGNPCHVCLIHPPGGVASGDRLRLDVSLQAGSHALLTTPAAGKFYRRGAAGEALVTQTFAVEQGVFEWLPQENIFYPNAAVELRSVVRLSSAARFIGWEIGCLGLPARGQSLEHGQLRLGFELWNDGRPLLLERLMIESGCLAPRWGMAARAAFGTALFFPSTRRELELANDCIATSGADLTIACTLVDDVLVCRAQGHRADLLKHAFVGLWRALRPALLGREAVDPRIWST